jgi:lysozyme
MLPGERRNAGVDRLIDTVRLRSDELICAFEGYHRRLPDDRAAPYNGRSWGSVTAEFRKWRMAKGVVLAGLVRRREAEAAMFMRGVRALAEDIAPVRDRPPPEVIASDGGWRTIVEREPAWPAEPRQ